MSIAETSFYLLPFPSAGRQRERGTRDETNPAKNNSLHTRLVHTGYPSIGGASHFTVIISWKTEQFRGKEELNLRSINIRETFLIFSTFPLGLPSGSFRLPPHPAKHPGLPISPDQRHQLRRYRLPVSPWIRMRGQFIKDARRINFLPSSFLFLSRLDSLHFSLHLSKTASQAVKPEQNCTEYSRAEAISGRHGINSSIFLFVFTFFFFSLLNLLQTLS